MNYQDLTAIERRELLARIDHAMRNDYGIFQEMKRLLVIAESKGIFTGVSFNKEIPEPIEQDYPDFVNSDL